MILTIMDKTHIFLMCWGEELPTVGRWSGACGPLVTIHHPGSRWAWEMWNNHISGLKCPKHLPYSRRIWPDVLIWWIHAYCNYAQFTLSFCLRCCSFLTALWLSSFEEFGCFKVLNWQWKSVRNLAKLHHVKCSNTMVNKHKETYYLWHGYPLTGTIIFKLMSQLLILSYWYWY